MFDINKKRRGRNPFGHHGIRDGERDDFKRHGGHREHGRHRLFDSSELRLLLLNLIEARPRHGYDLIRDIEERSGGAYVPSPGIIYPTLTLLADMALISEEATDGTRKSFSITAAGKETLKQKASEAKALFKRLTELQTLRSRTASAPVQRAMSNLREALQNRLSVESITVDTQHEIAALLDGVAQKIERL